MKEIAINYSKIPKMKENEFNGCIKQILDINTSIDFAKLKNALNDRYSNSTYAYELFNYILGRREKNASNVRDTSYLSKYNVEKNNRKHELCRKKHKTFYGKVRKIINKLLLKIEKKKKKINEDEYLR